MLLCYQQSVPVELSTFHTQDEAHGSDKSAIHMSDMQSTDGGYNVLCVTAQGNVPGKITWHDLEGVVF